MNNLDLGSRPPNTCLKPNFKRNKPKSKTLRELSPKEVTRLRDRSGGVCEKCDMQRAVEKAHVERRWKSTQKPTAEDFIHLCMECHDWADDSETGRNWLLSKQAEFINKALAQ